MYNVDFRLSTVKKADRILVVKEGKIVEVGMLLVVVFCTRERPLESVRPASSLQFLTIIGRKPRRPDEHCEWRIPAAGRTAEQCTCDIRVIDGHAVLVVQVSIGITVGFIFCFADTTPSQFTAPCARSNTQSNPFLSPHAAFNKLDAAVISAFEWKSK